MSQFLSCQSAAGCGGSGVSSKPEAWWGLPSGRSNGKPAATKSWPKRGAPH